MPPYRRLIARLLEEPRPLRFLASRVLWRSGLCRFLTVDLPGGYRMRFHPSALSAALWQEPTFRQDDVDVCERVLRPGDTFVDVGANVGQLSIVAARRVGRRGRVMAIEAHPRTFRFLQENLALNQLSWIDARNTAVGQTEGHVSFTDLALDDQNAIAPSATAASVVQVPVTTLDLLWPEGGGDIRLLKIDVEGFETKVLAGASRVLSRCQCLYIEESDRNLARFGATAVELRRTLETAGFQVFAFTLGRLQHDPPPPEAGGSQNLLAIRADAVAEIAMSFPASASGSRGTTG